MVRGSGPPPGNVWKLHCLWRILATLCHTLLICSVLLTNHNVVHRLNPTHKYKFHVDNNILFIMENTLNSATIIVTNNQQIILIQVSRNVKAVGL